MYRNAQDQFKVNRTVMILHQGLHDGSHQGSQLYLQLIIIVLETLYREIRSGYPEELLYADNLALVSNT